MKNRTVQELSEGWFIKDFAPDDGLMERAHSPEFSTDNCVGTTVPSSVQAALLAAGKIPDPYVEYNASKIIWIEEREWWFLRDFPSPARGKDQRVLLRFEGITYRAEIWLNGEPLGRIEGMFRNDEFDITPCLRPAGEMNRLSLRIRAQENAAGAIGGGTGAKVRTLGPVAQSMHRWNWCPHMVCVGIWRPVKLILRSDIWMERPVTQTLSVDLKGKNGLDHPRAGAEIKLEWRVRNSSPKRRGFKIDFKVEGETFPGAVAEGSVRGFVRAGDSKVITKKLRLKNAALWWPNGLGKAELHKLISILSADFGPAVQKSEEIFGVREITWGVNPGEDQILAESGSTERPWSMVGEMYKWTLFVNGWRLFMKGSNWVILDSMLRLEKWRYERQLSLFKSGGLNYLRVWGGSLAETDEFYDLCDRLGILCWQEFWLACGNYPGMDQEAFLRCVKDTVERLVNRASLTHYCGGNEYEPDSADNKTLVDKMAAVVAEADPGREFRRGSPYKGDRHGGLVITPFVTRNKYLDILPGAKRVTLMRSEVATGRSAPMLSSFERMMPENCRWPVDERMWRNFFAVPCEFLALAAEYDSAGDYKHALLANHFWHGQLCRVNMEYARSRMPGCSGNLNWQFNAPWPCMHREIVDMWGVPKPAYYYHVSASKPVIVSADIERYLWNPGETLNPDIHIVNDLHRLDNCLAKITLLTVDMTVLFSREIRAAAPENSAVKIGSLDYRIPAELAEKTVFLRAELYDGSGLLIHENLYWIAVSNNHEPEVKISLDGEWLRDDGSPVTLPGNDMSVKNPSFEYVIIKKGKERDLENQGSRGGGDGAPRGDIRYRRTFTVPEALGNRDLEFFTPGFEASDEVWVNGVKIGSREIKNATLDTGSWRFIPHGKENSSIYPDPDTEYMFYSDPLSPPRLKARFYRVPAGLLRSGSENNIELVIKTYYQKAVSNRMEIRPPTPNREAVSDYLRKGVFFSDLRRMPPAEIKVSLGEGGVRIENISGQMAFCVITEVISEASGESVPLAENAVSLDPGASKVTAPMRGSLSFPARVRVWGWNIPETDFIAGKGGAL